MEEEQSVMLVGLTPRQRECALERYALLRPCLEEGMTQSWVAREQQVSLSTVQRWMRVYREKGLSGLAPGGRADRGQVRGVPQELIALIEGLGLERIGRPVTAIHALVSEVARVSDWPQPSYGQVYRILRGLPEDVKTLAREGPTGYRETYDVLYRREASRANGIWQADHCRLCIYVCREKQESAKPWVTVILDDYSRAIAGYHLGWKTPSSDQTSLTLRQAIGVKDDPRWKICGTPERLYSDHGSDFRSKHLEAVAIDLKMGLVFSQVGKPRGRGKIERFFRTMEEMLLARLPGYAPVVKDLREQGEINACAKKEACLTLEELETILRNWLLETYQKRVHTETQMAPQERWLRSGVLPRLPENEEQLDLLLLQPRRRYKVHQEGIRFEGAWYQHALLGDSVGDAVTIRYDPMRLAALRVYVADTGGRERLLCEAQCVERGGEEITYQDLVAARTKRRKRVGKVLRERKEVVKRYQADVQYAKQALEQGRDEVARSERVGSVKETGEASLLPETEGGRRRRRGWYDEERED